MASEHMSNDEFFEKLGQLFENNRKKGHGTVYLTQKRLAESSGVPSTDKAVEDTLSDTHSEDAVPILIRASNNKSTKRPGKDREDIPKTRMSTVIQPDQLDAFYARYADVCRAGMGGLKKRDRKKGKKDKKKKKGGAAETKG